MSAAATSQTRTVKRVPHLSSTVNVSARARQASAIACDVACTPKTHPKTGSIKAIRQTTSPNHAIPKLRSMPPTDIATIKSP